MQLPDSHYFSRGKYLLFIKYMSDISVNNKNMKIPTLLYLKL